MAASPENDTSMLWKLACYALSFIVGFCAKIAALPKESKLTVAALLRDFAIAACAVWITWNICDTYGISNNSRYIYGTLAARFADAFVLLMWQGLKNLINKIGE